MRRKKRERERMIDRAYKYNGKGISTVEPRFDDFSPTPANRPLIAREESTSF